MDYPVWQLWGINGGLLVAIISVLHVFVAQFAVGGGFLLVHAATRAERAGSAEATFWVKRFTRFFLLLSMVFGGVSGVGIWVIISLISPAATSLLVHRFVYAWATEWVFFLGEIVALLVYYYGFGKMRFEDHRNVGLLYGLFAYLSLFMINGIITFMLTPGAWMQTQGFWDGFFNPTFWPSLLFRSALCAMLSGLFGLVWASLIDDERARELMTGVTRLWALVPIPFMAIGAWWYIGALPAPQLEMVLRRTADIRPFLEAFPWVLAALMVGGLAFFTRLPSGARVPVAALLLVLGLCQVGTFEWVRETGRRPWIVHGVIWSNGITPEAGAKSDLEGMLKVARWSGVKQVAEANMHEAGRELWQVQCANCHGLGAPMIDILPRIANRPLTGVEALIIGQGALQGYMPPFVGTPAERRALATYLVNERDARRH